MVIFDVIVLLLLAGFVFYGFFFGLIRAVGNLAGVVLGAWLAGRFYLEVFAWFDKIWPWSANVGKVISFIICFTIVSRLVGWGFTLFEQAFKVATVVPFVKTLNSLLGAVFGFIEGALVLGLILYVASRYLPASGAIVKWIDSSAVVAFLINFSKILAPLLPELYKRVRAIF